MNKIQQVNLFLKAYRYEFFEDHGEWKYCYGDLYSSILCDSLTSLISEVRNRYTKKIVHTKQGYGTIINIYNINGFYYAIVELINGNSTKTYPLSEIYLHE